MWNLLIPAAAAIGGALINKRSSDNALNAQQSATNEANALQRYIYDTQRGDLTNYRRTANYSLNRLQGLLRNPNSVRRDPGYRFGMREGINALENSASARGMTYSGAQSKALQSFGRDYASSQMDEVLNRYLAGAGLGQVNAGMVAAGNYANQVGSNLTNMGNAAGANALMKGSIYGNLFNQLGAAGMNYMNQPQRASFGPYLDRGFTQGWD